MSDVYCAFPKFNDLSKDEKIRTITNLLESLELEDRLRVFEKFCVYCGTDDLSCYCMRDD